MSLSKCSYFKSTLFALLAWYVYDITEININITYLVVPFGKVVLATYKQIYNEP